MSVAGSREVFPSQETLTVSQRWAAVKSLEWNSSTRRQESKKHLHMKSKLSQMEGIPSRLDEICSLVQPPCRAS